MNKLSLLAFLLLFSWLNEGVCAQAAFKNTAYAYTCHPEEGVSDTMKLRVEVYDKDTVLLFDTTWDYEPYRSKILVKEYNRQGKKLKTYTWVNDLYEQVVLFVRDSAGRLTEQIFKGDPDFSLKTKNILDNKGRIVESISEPDPQRQDNEPLVSILKLYYNENDKIERQETYVNRQLLKIESWEYDGNNNVIENSLSDYSTNSKELGRYEYDSQNRVVLLKSYIDDEPWAVQENEWMGKLQKSSKTHYTNGWTNYVLYRLEQIN